MSSMADAFMAQITAKNSAEPEFHQAVRARCDEVGALLHVDEVQAGWGRSGKFFCSEHFDLEPDIITMGKAMGGGIMPQSALIANSKAFFGQRKGQPEFRGMEQNPWWLSNTFAGSQLACAASLAVIEVYEKENLLEQCREKGDYLKGKLSELAQRYPEQLREVRGLGLWIGVECRTPEQGTRLADELFHRDVLVSQTINNPNTLRFQPPLIITQEQLDTVIQAVEDSLKAMRANPAEAG
ncbi:aminotransferase class III-fold pyridoxal phosphate-dependent enzyme [bacterium]|nr:aminotransferase class III-fold pyridoxal phosphate-dependent enzyme [bacterium]